MGVYPSIWTGRIKGAVGEMEGSSVRNGDTECETGRGLNGKKSSKKFGDELEMGK